MTGSDLLNVPRWCQFFHTLAQRNHSGAKEVTLKSEKCGVEPNTASSCSLTLTYPLYSSVSSPVHWCLVKGNLEGQGKSVLWPVLCLPKSRDSVSRSRNNSSYYYLKRMKTSGENNRGEIKDGMTSTRGKTRVWVSSYWVSSCLKLWPEVAIWQPMLRKVWVPSWEAIQFPVGG